MAENNHPLAKYRSGRNITQETLAGELGVTCNDLALGTRQAISASESGEADFRSHEYPGGRIVD